LPPTDRGKTLQMGGGMLLDFRQCHPLIGESYGILNKEIEFAVSMLI